MQSSFHQTTRRRSPTTVISIAISFSISNLFIFAPFTSVPCFSFLFISVFCLVLLLLSLFITFLLTCFFSSYHFQYVKFCLSTSLLFFSTSPLFIYLSFLLTSVLPYFLSSLLFPDNYLFPITFITPHFFCLHFHIFFICLYYFHSRSLFFLPPSLHFPLAIHAQYSDRCHTRLWRHMSAPVSRNTNVL